MTIREQIEQIIKSEKLHVWLSHEHDHIHYGNVPGTVHVSSAEYVAKLESLVRLLPGVVDAIERREGRGL